MRAQTIVLEQKKANAKRRNARVTGDLEVSVGKATVVKQVESEKLFN
jgi:hypothetical protein